MAVPRYRSAEAPALLSAGFRPFFLAAGLWAALAMALWLAQYAGALVLPTAFAPMAWHLHEMLFGFVAAAMAGFLLTAIPNWTGRLPLQGAPLALLVGLWLLGRVAVAFSARTGPQLAAAADVAFLAVFALAMAREIVAGRNWRNLPVLLAVTLLALANALSHAGAFGHAALHDLGKRLAIAVIVMLISLIGGRIIPSFTTNWLKHEGAESLPVPFGPFDRATLALSLVALAAWVAQAPGAITGALLIVAGAAHALRLARWRGAATLSEPLLWILHAGYAFLPAGLVLLGLAAERPALATTAIHALTAGAMGTMILAVMTRASLGHTKRPLTADRGTLAAYLLVLGAAVMRLAASFLGAAATPALHLAGFFWISAFALFAARYAPLYLQR